MTAKTVIDKDAIVAQHPWAMAAVEDMSKLDTNSSRSSEEEQDCDLEDVISVQKEEATVCTAATATSETNLEDSLTIRWDGNEIDVDSMPRTVVEIDVDELDVDEMGMTEIEVGAVHVDEIDVDELIANDSFRFKGHRSSIACLKEQPPVLKRSSSVPVVTALTDPAPLLRRHHTAPSKTTPRSSIKLSSLHAPILIQEKGSPWKQLPKPDLGKIHRASSLPLDVDSEEAHSQGRSANAQVSFADVQVRSYAQTVGDNPSVSYGPPIQLDWNYQECRPVSVDEYEQNRGGRRPLGQLGMSYYERMSVLQDEFGHSEEDLKRAKKQADRDKFKRAVTKYLLPVRVLEDAAESSVRKTKRYLQKRRPSTAA